MKRRYTSSKTAAKKKAMKTIHSTPVNKSYEEQCLLCLELRKRLEFQEKRIAELEMGLKNKDEKLIKYKKKFKFYKSKYLSNFSVSNETLKEEMIQIGVDETKSLSKLSIANESLKEDTIQILVDKSVEKCFSKLANANETIKKPTLQIGEEKSKSFSNLSVVDETIKEETMQIGANTAISKYKLLQCNRTNFRKYTSDLMKKLFCPNTLAESVIKSRKGNDKLKILDPVVVNDIQDHVSLKFNVSKAEVRSVIRSTLQIYHRRVKGKAKNE